MIAEACISMGECTMSHCMNLIKHLWIVFGEQVNTARYTPYRLWLLKDLVPDPREDQDFYFLETLSVRINIEQMDEA